MNRAMTTLQKLEHALYATVGASLGDLFWYALMAGAAWVFFYVLFRATFRHRRISERDQPASQVRREILQSLRSVVIFGLVTGAVVYASLNGHTRLYSRVETYGWWWFFLSLALMIVMHDAYFYWTHRLMHHPRLYRLMHHTHHLSLSPTPWAAYAFSPAEALVQAGIGPLIVFTLPTHPAAFALFMGWQIAFNVLGHCGYEILPRWVLRTPVRLFLNTVTHHALHHEKFRANFSLYFNVWDRLMGTNCADYEARLDRAAGATGSARPEPRPPG